MQSISDRGFQIHLRNGEDSDITILLSVVLPNTYPKTLPSLDLVFGSAVPSSVQLQARELVRKKPKSLLGSEMVFEIATALQELLMNVSKPLDGPSLEEERLTQHAQTQRSRQQNKPSISERGSIVTGNGPDAAGTEEDQALLTLVEQATIRSEKRRAKSPSGPDAQEVEAIGGLQFDHTIFAKDAVGSPTKFDVVHQRVQYRQGPVTKVSKVHVWNAPKCLEPFLVLKESTFQDRGAEDNMKEQIFDLDRRLDQVVQLPANLNIVKPLSYIIRRGEREDLDFGQWKVAILMELMPQGSMQDLLETTHILDVEPVRAWTLQLLEGLMFCHRHGIVHASVHLRNMLLQKSDTGNTVVRLADPSYQHTIHAIKNGLHNNYPEATSTYWTPPEVINGGNEGRRIAASDIWDLGTSFVQMLLGLKVQSVHRSPRDLIENLELSPSSEELLDQIFKTDHRKRSSAFELLPSTFFRNNDPFLSQRPLSRAPQSDQVSKLMPARHESVTATPISRYKTDFTEAGRLGRGGYGEVVCARNKLDGRFYAIKIIRSRSASALNDVLSEIMLLSQLNHPNVVRYFNAWLENEGSLYNARERSTSSGNSIDSHDELDDNIFEDSPSGLDFMSGNGPNIVFESDSDDEAPKPQIKSNNDSFAIDVAGKRSSVATEGEPSNDEKGIGDERASSCNSHSSLERTSPELVPFKTRLYIQMQYCEKSV